MARAVANQGGNGAETKWGLSPGPVLGADLADGYWEIVPLDALAPFAAACCFWKRSLFR